MPEGANVRVRVIGISQANDYCPGVIVRAAEHVFPHTSARKIAGVDICGFTSERVDAALRAAERFGDPSDSATETIVAQCGADQREFDFPYPVEADQTILKQSDPAVSHLWDTNYRIYRRALGKEFSFNQPAAEQGKEMEQLGTRLVPELTSGKYQAAYAGSKCGDHGCDNYLAWKLRGYTEAPEPYDPATVTLLDSTSLHLTKYVSPIMPPVAKTAHVYGDVRLKIFVDPSTGMVRNAEAVSGNPLFFKSSTAAAQSWQFAPQGLAEQPVVATLRFELRCR